MRMATTEAFRRHLWYLSEVTVGLALFDRNVIAEEKKSMITQMKETEGSTVRLPRLDSKQDIVGKPLSSFITGNTRKFFRILSLDDAFLSRPPES